MGRETWFTFDARNHQLSRTLPLGFGDDGIRGTGDDPVEWTASSILPADMPFTERMTYDAPGRQHLHISFEGIVTEHVYSDTTGRLIEKRFFDNLLQYDNGAGNPGEVWTYTHDAFGRVTHVVASVRVAGTGFLEPTPSETTTYDYNTSGIRVSALTETDANGNGTVDGRLFTEFLNDANNHTGYSQVLRESHYAIVDEASSLVRTIDYTFGHAEISQRTIEIDDQGEVTGDQTLIFGHDGHGSVRVLTDLAAAAVQFYAFDAYGQMLAIWNAPGQLLSGGSGQYANAAMAATTLLYAGEQFDPRIGHQYIRARYYDPTTARFTRLDPFFGRLNDPLSLHKYLYVHADPVNGYDPTGLAFSATAQLAVTGISGVVGATVGSIVFGKSGRSPGYGALTGFVGGTSLTIAFFTGKFAPVFLESAISGIFAGGLSALIDVANGDDPTNYGKYLTNGMEAFSWTVFFAQWYTVADGLDMTQSDGLDRFVMGVWLKDMQILTQFAAVFTGAMIDLATYGAKLFTVGLTPREKESFRSAVRDSTQNVINVCIGTIPQLIIAGTFSSLWGVRFMPARLQGELAQGVLDAANFGAAVAVDAIADNIADSITDAILGGAAR